MPFRRSQLASTVFLLLAVGASPPALLAQVALSSQPPPGAPYVGINLQKVTSEHWDYLSSKRSTPPSPQPNATALPGAFVSGLVPGGPAERAGVRPFDVILTIDGLSLDGGLSQLIGYIRSRPIGATCTLVVLRPRPGSNLPDRFEITMQIEATPRPGAPAVFARGAGTTSVGMTSKVMAPTTDRRTVLTQTLWELDQLLAKNQSSWTPTQLELMRARRASVAAELAALDGRPPPGAGEPTGPSAVARPEAAPPLPAPPATPPPAAPPNVRGAGQPHAYALVIGIERYRDVSSPTGARRDAEAMAGLLRTSLGVPEQNMLLALDERATRSDIEKHLRWLRTNVPQNGRVYFYFSGHGAPDPSTGTSYLVPYDGDPRFLADTSLQLPEVLKALSLTKAGDVLAMVDSCFSGAGGRSILPPGTRPLVKVQETRAVPRVALLSAASGSEISGPAKQGGGLFTTVVLSALGSGAADVDGDGAISLGELHTWIAPRVSREARRDNREQTPALIVGAGATAARDFIVVDGLSGR